MSAMSERNVEMFFRRAIGEADDAEQALYLEIFASSITDACKGDADNQYYYITKHLGPQGKKMILTLADYAKRRE